MSTTILKLTDNETVEVWRHDKLIGIGNISDLSITSDGVPQPIDINSGTFGIPAREITFDVSIVSTHKTLSEIDDKKDDDIDYFQAMMNEYYLND